MENGWRRCVRGRLPMCLTAREVETPGVAGTVAGKGEEGRKCLGNVAHRPSALSIGRCSGRTCVVHAPASGGREDEVSCRS